MERQSGRENRKDEKDREGGKDRKETASALALQEIQPAKGASAGGDRPEPQIPENPSAGDIVFEHVSFSYPGTEREMISDLSLTIRGGEKIAIVGDNGPTAGCLPQQGEYPQTKG